MSDSSDVVFIDGCGGVVCAVVVFVDGCGGGVVCAVVVFVDGCGGGGVVCVVVDVVVAVVFFYFCKTMESI